MADQTIFKADDLVVSGNLTVRGTQDVITTTETDLNIKDRLITLNKGGTLGTNVAGIEIESGGGIVATLGYTTASGFDFGNKNITTTGSIAGTLVLDPDSVNDTHIDWGTGANQVSTAVVPEAPANLYFSDAHFTTKLSAKTTADLTEGANLYYTTVRANTDIDARIAQTSVNLLIDADTTSTPPTDGQALAWNNASSKWKPATITGHTTTDTLAEGSTNLYYTNGRVENHLANISINNLGDVVTTGAGAGDIGKVLMWDGTQWQHNAIAVGVAKAVNGTFSSNLVHTSTSAGASGDHGTIVVTGPLTNYTAGPGKILVSCDMLITQSHPHTNAAGDNYLNKVEIKVHKAINGNALSNYANPIYSILVLVTNLERNISIQFIDDGSIVGHGSIPHGVTYHITTNSTVTNAYGWSGGSVVGPATSTITIPAGGLLGHAIELNTDPLDELGELTDVTLSTPATNQLLQYNAGTSMWQNSTYKINTTGVVTNNILKWDGVDSFVVSDLTGMLGLNSLSDVDTTGIVDDAIIKYDLATTTWKIATDVDTGIVNIVEDVSPQLGGHLDVNGNNIVSISDGNITIAPHGTGQVVITSDLTVQGTATTMDVQNMTVEDPVILLNKHDTQPATNTNDAGIMVQRGSTENNAAWFWDETLDRWIATTTTSIATATDINNTANADIQANIAYLTATTAQYGDLAEMYISDSGYETGTVVVFGGEKEVTQSTMFTDHRVAGVVSDKPAYLMNKDAVAGNPHLDAVAVALRGKVPCKIDGPVKKGDIIVTGTQPGTGTGLADDSAMPNAVCVIGKSIEDNNDTGVRLINIVV